MRTQSGTGPFTEIGAFQPQYYEIHKNPNYWQEGKPFIDGFRAPVYPNNDAANLAMVSGEDRHGLQLHSGHRERLRCQEPGAFHYWFPAVGTSVHLYTNTTRAPFDDPNVRKALSMAIDRDQIVTVAMYDYTHPSDATGLGDAPIPGAARRRLRRVHGPRCDVAKANELLDAAGLTREGDTRVLPDGTPMSYDLNVVSGWSDWVAACQIMAQNLEEVGITAAVKTYDFAAFYDILQKGDFDLSIYSGQVGPTPYTYYRNSMSNLMVVPVGELASQNFHRYSNSDADALLEQFASSGDLSSSTKLSTSSR